MSDYYNRLRKPWFTPPRWVFPIVWSGVLYPMLLFLFLTRPITPLYLVHLFLNFAWSPLFFRYRRVDLALVDAGLLVVTAIMLAPTFPPYFLVYVAWLIFALVLNASIFFLSTP